LALGSWLIHWLKFLKLIEFLLYNASLILAVGLNTNIKQKHLSTQNKTKQKKK